jgi:hypothetical protein
LSARLGIRVSRRPVAFLLTLASLAALSTREAWATPAASCRAERAGQRALVATEVIELLEPGLRRLVELGLVGRLRVEAALYRRRPLWFDQRVAEQVRDHGIGWSRTDRTLLLDGQRMDPAALARGRMTLPFLSLLPGRFRSGDHYVEINLRLEVVTSASLGEVARWLVDDADRSVVPRALVDYLAADLARTSSCRCEVEGRAR